MINQLICIMTSRYRDEALRPDSSQAIELENFLDYLDRWEAHAGGLGFLSESTATGLRVTVSSTLSLLRYITKELGFSYLMTSRTSQDPIENLFGIARQACGSNDHPTPQQFLATITCLSFYNIAKPPQHVNSCDPAVLDSLLGPGDHMPNEQDRLVDRCLAQSDVDHAGTNLGDTSSERDHTSLVSQKSDARLIYHMAGYVARRRVLAYKCEACCALLLTSSVSVGSLASFTRSCDTGGLLYPTLRLYRFVERLENIFTTCFSRTELHKESILDVLAVVKANSLLTLGCPAHSSKLCADVISFYIQTRLYFYTKALNQARATKRQKVKYLKMRRVT